MATKGVIVWRGDSGNPESHYSKSQISEVTSESALDTLATALAAYSDANVAKKAFDTLAIDTDSAPGASANVDLRAIYYFRDSATLKVHSCTIPAPVSTSYENKPEGDRVTAAALAAVISAINTATGKTYVGLYGVVEQKR